ncbi:HDOD domain-containing protein [Propionivibrio soli]|uniref:HDOD domain-containing protein n=1 Tax=Propionivibrio soli TaxID=2976531 RepID=UPI0021E6DD98|nr:HDOD domain-containing protein [Propionivibrio soli]
MTRDPATADIAGDDLSAQRFRMLRDIAKDLAGDVVFPTCFDAALGLRKKLQDPNISASGIARIVAAEPLIAAKLLQLANSAYYSPPGEQARDIQGVIVRLGVDVVRTTALAIAMRQLLRAKDMAIFSDLAQALWEHSIKTAAAAHVVARVHTRLDPGEALLAGLVHDLGAFYMLYRASQDDDLRVRPDTMKHLIMQWHESVGVSLLNALGLPEEIVNATIDHDRPRSVPIPPRSLADVLYVANGLAGAQFEWLLQDIVPVPDETRALREHYGDLLGDIKAEAAGMTGVFV